MGKAIGYGAVWVACGLVVAYSGYLLVANVATGSGLFLYPWPGGEVAAVWVLVAAMGVGALLVPAVRLLVRTVRKHRAAEPRADDRGQAY
ncbi:MAG TPA: hypothetical protein VMY69_05445 [Phycisphaerae bacterium]|nr:hypothetical protein [Phycisphaerae bacterium]